MKKANEFQLAVTRVEDTLNEIYEIYVEREVGEDLAEQEVIEAITSLCDSFMISTLTNDQITGPILEEAFTCFHDYMNIDEVRAMIIGTFTEEQ